jgi:hypothetical protein
MDVPQANWLSYRQALAWSRKHPLRLSEIPVEHAISLPLPTMTFGGHDYVQFAAPAVREPGQPTRQGAPDRWWAFEAQGGRLRFYALVAARPFGHGFSESIVSSPVKTMDELRAGHAEFEAAMEGVARDFFAGAPRDAAKRETLAAALRIVIPPDILPQYQAAAPDFFTWLAN